MTKSIYKITNIINNKCYIGQTNNVQRRFAEHKRESQKTNPKDSTAKILYRAIQKYGLENFNFEVLEENVEHYNEREKYWIEYFDSYNNGYNATIGGEEPPIFQGEQHHLAVHTQETVNYIIDSLLHTNKTPQEIAQETDYDISSILRINRGISWHQDGLDYPLRQLSIDKAHERALLIIDDLMNTKMTQREIANKYGVGRSTVTAINTGQNNRMKGINYPIRGQKENRQSKSIQMIDKNTNEVLQEFVSVAEAVKALGDPGARAAIQLCAAGGTLSSHGYKWKYID